MASTSATDGVMWRPSRLVFIGLGGIGSWLVEPVCRYFTSVCHQAVLVDGDAISHSNLLRQAFSANEVHGYKVHSLISRMRALFPGRTFSAVPTFVSRTNVGSIIQTNDAVFVSPDNHEARRVVAAEAKLKRNIAVFTAGNELHDGSVHVYLKLEGIEMSRDFMQRHPEAVDEVGETRGGCGELIDRGAVQLIAVNFLMAALVMLSVHLVFKYGSLRSADETWGMIPQELYGSLDGKVRASMVVQQALAKEAACTS